MAPAEETTAGVPARPRLRLPRLAGSRGLLYLAVAPVLLFLALPTLVVIPMALTPTQLIEFPPRGISFHSFGDFFSDPAWTSAAASSLSVAAIAVPIAVVVATLAAVALHGFEFRGKGLLLGLLLMPMVVPVVVLALADFEFLADFRLVGTELGIGIAHSMLATPYAYVAIAASLSGLNPELVRSARSLGAGNLAVFRHVYLPVMRPGIAAGALFAFAVSFDEAVIALFLSGPEATTLPVKMFTDIQFELDPTIAAVSSMLVVLATLVLVVQITLMLRRRARLALLPGAGLEESGGEAR